MAQLIPNEVPSGAIDGVNKIFTFLSDIDYFTSLTVDGTEYKSFSKSGTNNKQLILTDAPTTEIYGDYYPSDSAIPITTDITFGDIKDKVWNLLGQKSTSTNFSSTIVGDEINTVSIEVWRGRYTNLLNPQQIIRAGKLWFQDGDFGTRFKSGGICGSNVEVGDTEIETGTGNLNPAGYILLGSDIINYTGKTDTQITGVSGVTVEHLAGDKLTQLYEVPSDFETMSGIDLVTTGSNGVRYTDIPLNTGVVSYKILREDTTVLLQVNGLDNNDEIRVRYVKKYNDLSDNSDVCPFPDKYGTNVIAYLVAGGLAYDKGLPTSERILNRAYGNLKSMYQYYTNETKVIKQKLTPSHYSFNSIRLGGRHRI